MKAFIISLCSMCGFGIHSRKRPRRFDRLWERNPGKGEMRMNQMDLLLEAL